MEIGGQRVTPGCVDEDHLDGDVGQQQQQQQQHVQRGQSGQPEGGDRGAEGHAVLFLEM